MSVDLKFNKGTGYIEEGGKICMIRCFSCGKENYAPSVASGKCAWCNYNPAFNVGRPLIDAIGEALARAEV